MSDVQHLTHTKRHGTASPHERPAVRRRDGMAAQSLRRIAAVGDAVSFSRRPFFPPPKPSADCRHRADGEDGEAAGPKPGLFPQSKLFVDCRHRADGEGEEVAEFKPQLRALPDAVTVDAGGKRFVFHLFLDA